MLNNNRVVIVIDVCEASSICFIRADKTLRVYTKPTEDNLRRFVRALSSTPNYWERVSALPVDLFHIFEVYVHVSS